MLTMTFKADVGELDKLMTLLEEQLSQVDCPMRVVMQFQVAAEEAFVNVAHYAYAPGEGNVDILLDVQAHRASLTLVDSGKPYNPLERAEPDVTLSAEDRPIGGLGIYMIRKSMDDVSYVYRDGKNMLTMMKTF